MTHNVLITWELTNEPQSFEVECFNEKHRITTLINNGSFRSINLEGLHPSTSYTCCVLAIYEFYEAKRICNITETPDLFSSGSNLSSTSVNVIGGILGFIIAILVVVLAVCGVTLVYLLQPRFLKSVVPIR